MNTKLSLAIVASGVLICCHASAQNGLRPNRLPDAPARPIQEANEEPTTAASAQEPATASQVSATQKADSTAEARLLLHEASELSQVSKSIEQFTAMIELCKRANAKSLSVEELKYSRDLQSWAYNKRGEAYAAQAAEFMKEGSDREAAKLDRHALDDFQASVKLDPNRWKAIHNRAVSFGVLGLHEDASADFTRVVQLKPSYANAWFNRAEIHLESGRTAEAVRDYSEAIKLKPDDATAHRQRGRALAQSGKTSQALEDFNRAVELNSNDAISLVERGETYAELADSESADLDFRTAMEVDPDCAEAYRGAAWLMATCSQAKYRNGKFAVEFGERAMGLAQAQQKHDFTYYDTLAAAYANVGRFDDAQQMLQKAIPRAPQADAAAMKRRLALYAKERPFRQGAVATAQPASLKVKR